MQSLKETPGKDIWLVGGSQLNTTFLRAGLLDKLTITLVPISLGTGIPLFSDPVPETSFRLLKTEAFETGFVQLTYAPVTL